jgi:hypothetical protein
MKTVLIRGFSSRPPWRAKASISPRDQRWRCLENWRNEVGTLVNRHASSQ